MGMATLETTLYDRIKMLCERNSVTLSQLEDACGLGNGTISKWKSRTTPSIDKVVKIAAYFNVSVDFLSGRTDIESPAYEILGDDDMIAFQRARENSSPSDRKTMMAILRAGFKDAFGD